MMTQSQQLSETLVDAIFSKRLRPVLAECNANRDGYTADARSLLDSSTDAVARVDEDLAIEIQRVQKAFAERDVEIQSIAPSMPEGVVHMVNLRVSASQLNPAADLLDQLGYRSDLTDNPDLWCRFTRFYDQTAFRAKNRSQHRIILFWQPASRIPGRLGAALKPTVADLRVTAIPEFAWPFYYVVRIFRRIFKGSDHEESSDLGPFLGTPDEMIEPLLAFSGLKRGGGLIDLGCGDGRVLIASARSYGCNAIGYENNTDLVALARRAVHDNGLDEQVTIVLADANDADVSDTDVVFLFLPAGAVATLLPQILGKMKPGAVVIAHEQNRIDTPIDSHEEKAMITRDGISVARKWIVC